MTGVLSPWAHAASLFAVEPDEDWREWLHSLFPGETKHPFAPHHEQFWDWVWSIAPNVHPEPFVAVWPRGGAKALALDEVIPTPCGWTNVGALVIGSRVLDEQGQACTVLELSPVERRSLYRVTTKTGATLDVSGDHLWTVLDAGTRRLMRPGGFVPTSWATDPDLSVRCGVDMCGRLATRAGQSCRSHARHVGAIRGISGRVSPVVQALTLTTEAMLQQGLTDGAEWRFAVPTSAAWELPAQDLPIDPYVLGMWLGDGTTTQGVITVGHQDAAETTAMIQARGFDVRWTDRPGSRSLRLVGFRSMLRAAGLLGYKHVPVAYMRGSIKQRTALLAGLCDSDGSVHRNAVAFVNTNHRLAEAAHELAVSLGWRASIHESRATLYGKDCGPVWRVGIAAAPRDVFGLARKRDLSTMPAMSFNRHLHYITSIVRLPDADVRCLVVDSPSHLFLAGRSAIATHNSSSAEMAVVALGARRIRRYGLYISATQDQADDHVNNVAGLLESEGMTGRYPDMATRRVGKYGASKGWRRNRLRTASGFSIDAMGLDSAARGIKLEDARPDFLVIDDIDKETDSAAATERKIKTLTRGVFPSGSADCAILAIQNLVHQDSVFARLVDGRAEFLATRIVSGPVKALDGMAHETIGARTLIVSGRPTWVGQSLDRCQEQVDDWGISAFLGEAQHDVTAPPGGMFDRLSFAHCAIGDVPDLVRTVVWVDPAVTDKDTSDSHGIQADGIDSHGTIYRLRSWEARTSPRDSLRRAITIAIDVGADHVGVETDQGGDTWMSVYREAAQDVLDERVGSGMMASAIPAFTADKAGSGYGPKNHRATQMLADYERCTPTGRPTIVHVLGTHDVLEAALRRFPKTKPLDLVDTSFWAWNDLRNRRGRVAQTSYTDLRGRR